MLSQDLVLKLSEDIMYGAWFRLAHVNKWDTELSQYKCPVCGKPALELFLKGESQFECCQLYVVLNEELLPKYGFRI